MNVYGWFSDSDNFATVSGISVDDQGALQFDFRLERLIEPVRIEAVYDDRGYLPLSDFPNTGVAYRKCLSGGAYEALRRMLEPAGTTKRAVIDEDTYYLFWPGKVVDCLDIEKSEIVKRPSGYVRLVNPVFSGKVSTAGPVFLLPQFKTQCTFVTEQFVTAARTAKLKGLELRQKF